jgi:hypothetical protein
MDEVEKGDPMEGVVEGDEKEQTEPPATVGAPETMYVPSPLDLLPPRSSESLTHPDETLFSLCSTDVQMDPPTESPDASGAPKVLDPPYSPTATQEPVPPNILTIDNLVAALVQNPLPAQDVQEGTSGDQVVRNGETGTAGERDGQEFTAYVSTSLPVS